MAESDFFINHKRYPRCKRSHIMYNHTLKGGLRAGNFSMLASVDDIEVGYTDQVIYDVVDMAKCV